MVFSIPSGKTTSWNIRVHMICWASGLCVREPGFSKHTFSNMHECVLAFMIVCSHRSQEIKHAPKRAHKTCRASCLRVHIAGWSHRWSTSQAPPTRKYTWSPACHKRYALMLYICILTGSTRLQGKYTWSPAFHSISVTILRQHQSHIQIQQACECKIWHASN